MDPERNVGLNWRPQTSTRFFAVHFDLTFGVPAGPRLLFRLVSEPDTDILRPCMVGLADSWRSGTPTAILRPCMVGLVVRYPDSAILAAIQAAKSCCLFRDVKPFYLSKIDIFRISSSKNNEKKREKDPVQDRPREFRTEILRKTPVEMPRDLLWRPIW